MFAAPGGPDHGIQRAPRVLARLATFSSWIVLAVAAVADGVSLVQTLRQARREAALWNTSALRHLRGTSDPTLRALAIEDAAALVGVTIAALGLLVHELGGPATATRSLP